MTLSAPIWIVALALAACAPWIVRALADRFDARVRARTEALVARARARASIAGAPPAVVSASHAREGTPGGVEG